MSAGLWSGVASAQSSEKDADAERLFREGQKLLQEHRYGEACPKFEAAYAKDHQLGTLLNLAYCHKEQGSPWRAWVEFKEAEVLASDLKRTDRRDFARQRMAELEKSLGHIAIDLTARVELTDVLVGDEDRRVPEAEKGVPFAAEPGQRKVTFRAKGKKDKSLMVAVVKGAGPVHVAVPVMEDADPTPPPVAATPASSSEPSKKAPAAQEEDTGRGRKVLMFGLVGLGVVGVGLGTVTGLMTINNDCATHGRSTKTCLGGVDPQSRDKVNQAESTGLVSTVAFIGGGAALAGALILYVTSPSGKTKESSEPQARRITPELGAGWAGVSGTF